MNSGHSNGIKVVGYFDCYGGGQVVVRERIAYVGHIAPPHGTSIIDVSDPSKPRELATISVPEGTLSHKVRVENGVMLVNREIFPIGRKDPNFRGGLEVYDVSRPADPRRIASFSCRGMHRFTFDGRYVYGSPEMDGYLGNIVGIIDFQDPARPELVSKWWMPGQWSAGGERPTWEGTAHRCHHPIRHGDRLYVSYWHGGFVDSRHRGSEQAEIRFRPRLVAAVSLADPYRAAGAVCAARPPRDASRRRRRRAARPGLPVVPVDRRHHRRNAPDSIRELSSRRGSRLAETGLHRLAPVLRRGARHGNPHRLVCARAENRRHRQSARPARDRIVHAAGARRGGPGPK